MYSSRPCSGWPERTLSEHLECPWCGWDLEGDFAHDGNGYGIHRDRCGRRRCERPLVSAYFDAGDGSEPRVLGTAVLPAGGPDPLAAALELIPTLPAEARLRLSGRLRTREAARSARDALRRLRPP